MDPFTLCAIAIAAVLVLAIAAMGGWLSWPEHAAGREETARPKSCSQFQDHQSREIEVVPRVLYKGADGYWREAPDKSHLRSAVYTLAPGETWHVLSGRRVLVLHPSRQPKIVHPSGRVEMFAGRGPVGLRW